MQYVNRFTLLSPIPLLDDFGYIDMMNPTQKESPPIFYNLMSSGPLLRWWSGSFSTLRQTVFFFGSLMMDRLLAGWIFFQKTYIIILTLIPLLEDRLPDTSRFDLTRTHFANFRRT